MRAVFTEAALADLENIVAYSKQNFPGSTASLELRIRSVIARIEQWPESGRQVAERSGVRVVPLVRYPFRIFYRIAENEIYLLHIHHAARDSLTD